MGLLDEKKTFIDIIKGVFYILITGLFAMCGYLFDRLDSLSIEKISISFGIITLDILAIFLVTIYLIKKTKELREL